MIRWPKIGVELLFGQCNICLDTTLFNFNISLFWYVRASPCPLSRLRWKSGPYKYNQKQPGPTQFWRRLSWVFSQGGSCQAAYTNGGRADLESILCFRQIFCSYLAKAKQCILGQSNTIWLVDLPSVKYLLVNPKSVKYLVNLSVKY